MCVVISWFFGIVIKDLIVDFIRLKSVKINVVVGICFCLLFK